MNSTVTTFELNEWSRMAVECYKAGRNDLGHKFSSAAATHSNGSPMPCARFDELMATYRSWLVFGFTYIPEA